MAFSKTVSQICIMLTTFYSLVCSQQATAPADANTLFSNLLATSNGAGLPPNANSISFGATGGVDLGTGGTFGTQPGQNFGFPGGATGAMPGRGMPSTFPSYPTGGMNTQQTVSAPLPRPNPMQSMMPYMMMRGSDMMQTYALASMLGGGAAGGAGGGGMMSNPFLMMSMLNNM